MSVHINWRKWPRCPSCKTDAFCLNMEKGLLECYNPKCDVLGFKVDNKARIIEVWRDQKIESEEIEEREITIDDIDVTITEEECIERTLELWRLKNEQYMQLKRKKSVASRV